MNLAILSRRKEDVRMTDKLGFWIKSCRNNAGFTQELASERLCISLRKYQGWELGESTPTEDDLLRMEELFQNPTFSVRAMEIKSPIWKKKAKEATAAIITLHSIQVQLSSIMPQILGMADTLQTITC